MGVEKLCTILGILARRCFQDGQYEQAVGIALESRRLDKLEETIRASPNMVKILTYSLQVCQTLVISREFRQEVALSPGITHVPLGLESLILLLQSDASRNFASFIAGATIADQTV